MRKLKESRALSFAVIAVIYIIATIAGVATYKALYAYYEAAVSYIG